MRPALALLLFAFGLLAQPLEYSLLPPNGTAPSPRIDGTVAYDAANRRILLFGGDDGRARNDLWSYSLTEQRWQALTPTGTAPAPRFGHTAILDPEGRQLVIFGGQASGFFSDVWAYQIDTNSWRQLAPEQAGPSRRYGHSAIYDPARRRMVVSHGFTSSGRFDDTWAFNLTNNTWRDISPTSGRPLRRCLHHAVLDSANQRMLLFGGCASGFGPCPLNDLWAFDLVNGGWRQIQASGPSGREHYGVAFEDSTARMLLFSGSQGTNDTWAFDARTNRWEELRPPGTPLARSRHQGVALEGRGSVAFFGGSASVGRTNELWLLGSAAGTNRPRLEATGIVNAFSGTNGGVAPGEAVSLYGTLLAPNPLTFGFDAATGTLPFSGPGVEVRVNGILAPLYFISPEQINLQVPYELEGAPDAEFVVTVNGQRSEPVRLPLRPANPGLVTRAWNQDGSLNSESNPAAPGSIIVLYGTGQGVTVPASRTGAPPQNGIYPNPAAPLQVLVSGQPAEVLFQGQAPGTTGIFQINARLPQSATGPADARVRIGDQESAPIRIWVRS